MSPLSHSHSHSLQNCLFLTQHRLLLSLSFITEAPLTLITEAPLSLTLIAEALSTAGNDDGVLHQLLAFVADEFRRYLHLLGSARYFWFTTL